MLQTSPLKVSVGNQYDVLSKSSNSLGDDFAADSISDSWPTQVVDYICSVFSDTALKVALKKLNRSDETKVKKTTA